MLEKSKYFCRKALHQLSIALLRSHRFSWRQPKTVLFVFFLLLVLIFPLAGQLRFLVSAEDLLDPSSISRVHLEQLRADFEAGESVYAVFKPKSTWTPKAFCDVRHWISAQALDNDDLLNIRSPVEIRKAQLSTSAEGYLQRQFPPLLDLDCNKINIQSLASSPWGSFFTSQAGDDLGIDLFFPKDHSNKFQSGFDPERIQKIMTSISTSFPEKQNSWEIHWGGLAYFQDYVFKALQIKNLLNLVLILGFLFFFRLILGSWRSGFIYVGTVVFTCGLVFGLMASQGHSMDVLSSSIMPMILVAALEDFLFLCLQLYNDPRRIRQHFRKLVVPSFFTSASTAIGFGSLCVSGLQGVDRFGLWAAVASLIEWIIVFLLLPAFIKLFPKKMHWVNSQKIIFSIFEKKWFSWQPGKKLTLIFLLLMGIAPLTAIGLKVVDSPNWTFSNSHPYNLDLSYLKKSRGWEGQLDLVFTDSLSEKKNQNILQKLSLSPHVQSILNPYDIRSYVIQDLPEFAKTSVQRDFESSRTYEQFFSHQRSARAQIFLKSTSTEALRPLFTQIQQLCANKDCYPAGEIESFFEMNEKVLNILLESLVVSVGFILAILLFLTLAKSNLKGFLFLAISSLWGPFLMILVMAAAHIPVTYVTCIFASVLVGLTGDNAIQFLFASRHAAFRKGIHKLGGSSITLALAMSGSCLLFFLSPFESEKNLGWLFSIGFILCAVGDIWLLQGLESLWPTTKLTKKS